MKVLHVLVISRYKDDIIVITQDRGGTEVKCNNNDIIQVREYNWLLSQIKIGNYVITSCLVNKHVDDNYC